MKVWWCEQHKCASTDPKWCVKSVHPASATVLVPMQLIPDDALVIEKENGEWPKGAIDLLHYDLAALAESEAVDILDALDALTRDSS